MATEHQCEIARLGGGNQKMGQGFPMAMVAGATTTLSFTPPAGSRVTTIRWHTPVTYTGVPTNIFLTVGKTAGASDYLANTDVKTASAPAAATLVVQPDYASWPAGQAVFVTLTANGGTNPAGATTVELDYAPPNF